MPDEQIQPVENSAPALDPQGDASGAPPLVGPKYAALDEMLPDSEEVDEQLRGKSVAEVARLAKQWRGEIATVNKENREATRERLELARTLLALKQEPPRGAPQPAPRVYVPNERGEAVEAPMDELMGHRISPLEERINQLNESVFWQASETARERGRGLVKADPEIWEAASPDLGMFLQANQLDPRDPNNWKTAWEGARKRAMLIAGHRAVAPTIPPPPVGNATSLPNTARPGPKLSTEQMRNLDETAAMAGIEKGSKAYKKLIDMHAKDIAAGGWAND